MAEACMSLCLTWSRKGWENLMILAEPQTVKGNGGGDADYVAKREFVFMSHNTLYNLIIKTNPRYNSYNRRALKNTFLYILRSPTACRNSYRRVSTLHTLRYPSALSIPVLEYFRAMTAAVKNCLCLPPFIFVSINLTTRHNMFQSFVHIS